MQSVTLRYYQLLSENITRLEEDIERHIEECNTLWEHLFESDSFRTRIRPVI
jgi:alpha-amylase/alpha-mannosidase (GH57 family)